MFRKSAQFVAQAQPHEALRVRDLQASVSRVARSSWYQKIPELSGRQVIDILESRSVSANGKEVTPFLFPRKSLEDKCLSDFLERVKNTETRVEGFPQLVLPYSVWSREPSQALLTQLRSIPHILQILQLSSFPMDQPWIVLFRLYVWQQDPADAADAYARSMDYTKDDWIDPDKASGTSNTLIDWIGDLVLVPTEANLSVQAVKRLVAPPGGDGYKTFESSKTGVCSSLFPRWDTSEDESVDSKKAQIEDADMQAQLSFLKEFERAVEHVETLRHLEGLRKIEW